MIDIVKRRLHQAQLIKAARAVKAVSQTSTNVEGRQLTEEEQKLASAMRRRSIADERTRDAEQRVAEEAKRQTRNSEKTARLRELRLVKEAAEREARARPQPKPSKCWGK